MTESLEPADLPLISLMPFNILPAHHPSLVLPAIVSHQNLSGQAIPSQPIPTMGTAIWDCFRGLPRLPGSRPLLCHLELSCQVQTFTLLSLCPRMLTGLRLYPQPRLLQHRCQRPRAIPTTEGSVYQFFLHKGFLLGLVRTTVRTRSVIPAVTGHRPNQEGIPGHRGSLLCLCCCSSSSRGSAGLGFFSGKRSGKVKVCPWAWGRETGA